jgi:hypothetical protein
VQDKITYEHIYSILFENVAKLKNVGTQVAFMKKLRAEYIWEILATTFFRICVPV